MGNSQQKISQSLGIDDVGMDELEALEQQVDGSLSPEEIEAREKEILRTHTKEEIAKLNSQIDDIASSDDENFIKQSLKLVATKGFKILNTVQKEIENDPRERTVEVASETMGAITKAIETLDKYNKGETQLEQAQEKIELRRSELEKKVGIGVGDNNTVIIASTNDVLKQILQQEIVIEDDDNDSVEVDVTPVEKEQLPEGKEK